MTDQKIDAELDSKKLGFFSTTCLATGTIIGAGVFGTIPAAAQVVGSGVIWAYVVAFVTFIICYLPPMITISVLPAPFTRYMHTSRLVHPALGYMQIIYGFNYVFILSSLAGVFAYFAQVYIPIDKKILGIGILLIFAGITTLGANVNAIVQNIMVLALFAALFAFTIIGFQNIDAELLSISDVIAPKNITIVSLGSAVALLTASLGGGESIAFYPEKIKNPGKNVPWAFILATGSCCLIFMLVSTVTIGVLPMEQVSSLLDVAEHIFNPVMYHFFILVGAIFAILTSLNGIFVAGGHVGISTSYDKVLPRWFGKLNKHEVPSNTVWLLAVVSCLLYGFGFSIGTLLTAYALLNLLGLLVLFIPALKIHKLYPNLYKNAHFKLPPAFTAILTILGVSVCIWQLISILITLDFRMIVTIIIWYVAWYIFYFGRRQWLGKQGFDLDVQMRTHYPEWIRLEKELANKITI